MKRKYRIRNGSIAWFAIRCWRAWSVVATIVVVSTIIYLSGVTVM